jgi:AraC-like DNA-binding protein
MDTRIAQALERMEQQLETRLAIEVLAAAVDLSPSRFAHLFRRHVGTSPARYVHALRMVRARLLLERTFLSVREVMALVGCHDPSHFSRDFRSFHGVAPRTCRLGADRSRRDADPLTVSAQESFTVARIAGLANERNRMRKQRPRARAPDGTSSGRNDDTKQMSTTNPQEGSMSRVSLLLVVMFTAVLSFSAAPARAQTLGQILAGANTLTVPVVSTGTAAAFAGTFTLQRFVATATGVNAVGVLTGIVTPAGGTPTSIVQNVVVPVSATQTPTVAATCPILHLDLGPLALNVLGLTVDLNQVILDIAAQSGAGNLLGNLLCSVTGLLDSPGGLARLLNQILGILG